MARPESHLPVPGLGDERDRIRTPWGWLRGFAWFLLAWPLMGLLALGELSDFDWESILIAMLVPAGIGVLLLSLDRVLTRLFGVAAATAAQPVPAAPRPRAARALGASQHPGPGQGPGQPRDLDRAAQRPNPLVRGAGRRRLAPARAVALRARPSEGPNRRAHCANLIFFEKSCASAPGAPLGR